MTLISTYLHRTELGGWGFIAVSRREKLIKTA
jgi:hypothetical protein